MRCKSFTTAAVWACCFVAWQAASHAQTTIQADFDTTFPVFGYAYDFSGYGNPPDYTAIDTSDQVTSSSSVLSPAATAQLDTTAWAPQNMEGGYTYAGWGLGIGFGLPEDQRATSGDLSQYSATFDVSVAGYDPLDDGLTTDIVVIFQAPDADMDGDTEEVRIGVPEAERPIVTTTPQTITVNFGNLTVANSEFDFTTNFADAFQVLLQLQPNTNATEIGFDADNVITLDNVVISGPFATGGGGDGDFDGNQVVDGNDFLVWQRGETPNALSPDELAQWQANYGTGGGAAASAAAAIPEPAAAALAALGLGGLALRTGRGRAKR